MSNLGNTLRTLLLAGSLATTGATLLPLTLLPTALAEQNPPAKTPDDNIPREKIGEGAPQGRAKIKIAGKDAATANWLQIFTSTTQEVPVEPYRKGPQGIGRAQLEGSIDQADSSLLIGKLMAPVTLTPSNDPKRGKFLFSVPVWLEKENTEIMLTLVDPHGQVKQATLRFELQDWNTWTHELSSIEKLANAPFESALPLTIGAGVTSQVYSTPGYEPLSQLGLTIKAAAEYAFQPGRWSVGGNAFVTALPLTSNYADAAHENLVFRTLGGNLRVGYRVAPWFSLMAGTYYSTTLVSPERFGYRHVGGPQIFPVLRHTFASGGAVSGYVKFSPVAAGFAVTSLANNEIATGISYRFASGSGRHPISISADFARLTIDVTPYGTIESRSMTLGAAVGF